MNRDIGQMLTHLSNDSASRPPRSSLRPQGRNLLWALLLFISGPLALAAAPDDFSVPPAAAAPRPLRIDAPVEQRLPNGMRIVLAQRPGVKLVTADLLLLSGSEADPPERAGLASMTAALLTKGTRLHTASALAGAAESLGGSLDSAAGWDRAQISITVSVPKLDAAMSLLSEAVIQPTFAQDEIERLRTQSLDDLKVAYTRPGTLASLTGAHLLFGNGAYGLPAGGTPASLARITRADVTAMHASVYRPDNAVLVLAGDIDAAGALQLATRYFGAWAAGAAPAMSTAVRSPAPAASTASRGTTSDATGLPQTEVVIDMPQSGQAAVVIALPLPPLDRGDRATGQVLNSVLGGGFSARLSQEIRIKRGLSYGAGSRLEANRRAGSLRLQVQTKNPSAAEVATLMQSELDRLISTPVGADELGSRKAALIGGFSQQVETTAGLAGTVAALIVAGEPPETLRTLIKAFEGVSSADVQRFAAAYLTKTRRRLVIAGEAAAFGEGLKAQAPGVLTIPAAALNLERGGDLNLR